MWHTGHLIATFVTLAALIETFGRRRAWLLGLLVGAGFLTRAPLALAAPFFGWVLADRDRAAWRRPRDWLWRAWVWYALGIAPAAVFFLWYNAARFGSPLESGYVLASLPPFLEAQRARGLFSLSHLGMNLDYLFTLPHSPSRPDRAAARLAAATGWARAKSADQFGTAAGATRRFAIADDRRARADGGSRAPAEPALLRWRLAPVRLPLRAGLDPVRDGHRGARRGSPGPPDLGQGREDHLVAFATRMLLHDNGVGTGRQFAAGENARRLSRLGAGGRTGPDRATGSRMAGYRTDGAVQGHEDDRPRW